MPKYPLRYTSEQQSLKSSHAAATYDDEIDILVFCAADDLIDWMSPFVP